MTSTLSFTKHPYQSQSKSSVNSSVTYPNINLCFQNIKYFLESYKACTPKDKVFSEKFINTPLYSEDSQIPESFYKLHKPFDRNTAFFIPHGNRRNGNHFRSKNWYPKYPLILSKNCELIKRLKSNEINNNDRNNNIVQEGAKDFMMKKNMNKYYCIKYVDDDGKNVECGPYPSSAIYFFLNNYYIQKTQDEKKKMNLLVRDIFDDSYFPPDTLYLSLKNEIGYSYN